MGMSVYGVKKRDLVMRRQSPKAEAKSGDMWDMEGCAFAKRTSSVTSIGPGMLQKGLRRGGDRSEMNLQEQP